MHSHRRIFDQIAAANSDERFGLSVRQSCRANGRPRDRRGNVKRWRENLRHMSRHFRRCERRPSRISSMARGLVLLAFMAGSAAYAESDVADRIAAIEGRVGRRIGVAALDTGNRKRFDYRADERFPMCNTFKFLAAAAVLKRVDEKKEKLERFVSYGAKEILEYAPVTKEHLKEGGMTLRALCAAAIEQSDNTAGNLLLDVIGGPAGLTNFVRTLGDRVPHLDRIEPELNSAIPGDERDTTTPAAISSDMHRLLLGDALSEASRRQLDEWLQRNETGGPMIRAGVPKTWSVGDKTGRGSN